MRGLNLFRGILTILLTISCSYLGAQTTSPTTQPATQQNPAPPKELTIDELEKQLKEDKRRLKLLVKDLDQKKRIQMPIFRRYGRNIKDIIFDFETKKFANESGLSDTLRNPPYEIHEMDGIRIKVKNVNPFIYSVDLYELQGDQISTEKLLETTQKNSIDFKAEPFKEIEFNISMKTLPATPKCDSAKIKALLDKRNLVAEMRALRKLRIETQNLIDIYQYANDNKINLPYPLLFSGEAYTPLDKKGEGSTTYNLQKLKKELLQSNARMANVVKGVVGIDTINLDIEIMKEKKAIAIDCEGAKQKQLQEKVQTFTSRFKHDVLRINKYIFFHNQLIRLVKSPNNDFNAVEASVNALYKGMNIENSQQLAFNYYRDYKTVLLRGDSLLNVIDELGSLLALAPEDQKIAIFKLDAFIKEFTDFNHEKLVGQIASISELIKVKFFEVNYQTLSIAENADFVKYRLEFKPNPGPDVQLSTPYNLDISFLVNEGLKLDVSTGLMLDFNLTDPKYFFEKYTVESGSQSYDSAIVRKSKESGNITPSINLMLNAYKRSSLNFKPGFSLGFGFSSDIRFRLYAGPTLIVGRKERIMINAGVAFGPVARNADGYEEGKKFENNSSLPADVPMVLDKYMFGWYMGVGFNLTGKDTKGLLEKIKFK